MKGKSVEDIIALRKNIYMKKVIEFPPEVENDQKEAIIALQKGCIEIGSDDHDEACAVLARRDDNQIDIHDVLHTALNPQKLGPTQTLLFEHRISSLKKEQQKNRLGAICTIMLTEVSNKVSEIFNVKNEKKRRNREEEIESLLQGDVVTYEMRWAKSRILLLHAKLPKRLKDIGLQEWIDSWRKLEDSYPISDDALKNSLFAYMRKILENRSRLTTNAHDIIRNTIDSLLRGEITINEAFQYSIEGCAVTDIFNPIYEGRRGEDDPKVVKIGKDEIRVKPRRIKKL